MFRSGNKGVNGVEANAGVKDRYVLILQFAG